MRQLALVGTILGALLAAPLVGASSHVNAGVAEVIIIDDRGSSCSFRVGPTCQANATINWTNPGNDTFDAHQRIAYVGVATNIGWIAPVDEHNASVRGDSIVAPDPVTPAAIALWDQHQNETDLVTNATLVSDDQGFYLRWWGPDFLNPPGPWTTHETGEAYVPDGQPGLHHGYIGPFTNPAPDQGATTDNYFWGNGPFVCAFSFVDDPACHGKFDSLDESYNNSTPNVIWGVDWYSLQAATDPHGLTPPPDGNDSESWANVSYGDPPNATMSQEAAHDEQAPADVAPARDLAPEISAHPPAGHSHGNASVEMGSAHILPPLRPPPEAALIVAVAASAAAILVALILAGYSRFESKKDVLSNPSRLAILDAVKAEPGLNIKQLAAKVKMDRATVRHHLKLLRYWGLVVQDHGPKETRCYPPGAAPVETTPTPQDRILAILTAAREGMTREALHAALADIPQRTRNHALKRLITRGVVRVALSEPGESPRFQLTR